MYLEGIYPVLWWSLRLLRWTACTNFLSVLLSAVPASRDRGIPPFLLLWTLWDLRKDFIKPLTMTSWYMRLHGGLEDREQSDNPKRPAWRSSSCFWKDRFLGSGTKTTWRNTAYQAKWKLCCGRCCVLFVTIVVHHPPRGDRNLLAPEPCIPLEKGEQVEVLAPVWWGSPKEGVLADSCHAMAQEPCLYCLLIKNFS